MKRLWLLPFFLVWAQSLIAVENSHINLLVHYELKLNSFAQDLEKQFREKLAEKLHFHKSDPELFFQKPLRQQFRGSFVVKFYGPKLFHGNKIIEVKILDLEKEKNHRLLFKLPAHMSSFTLFQGSEELCKKLWASVLNQLEIECGLSESGRPLSNKSWHLIEL